MKKRAAGLSFWTRRTLLEKAAALVLLLSLIVDNTIGTGAPFLATILHLATAGCFLALLARYLRTLLSMAIWRLRNRLLITYLFIGVVPVMLIAGMALISLYIFYGMASTYMTKTEVGRLQEQLSLAGRAVALDLEQGMTGAVDPILTAHLAPNLRDVHPAATLLAAEEVAPWLVDRLRKPAAADSFQGLVRSEGAFELQSVTRSRGRYLKISAGLERMLSSAPSMQIGVVTLATEAKGAGSGKQFRLQNKNYRTVPFERPALPPPANWWDIEVTWPSNLSVSNEETGEAQDALMLVHTRPSLINERLFSNLGGDLTQLPVTILAAVAILFILIETGSLWVGTHLTTSITRVIHDLSEGTERVNRGDFSYRIPVRSRDQLSGLAESFNSMTGSLERLIQESKEKERLQSELEIASQVQRQLFPKQLPSIQGLELAGVCRPARVVSGDYYDFVVFNERQLALAIGDIAGKGISAALVMAGIQSSLHAQLHQWRSRSTAVGEDGISPERLVAQLNRQLFESTSSSTFATFCYATYDDREGRLTYTNAGHLPPLIVSPDGGVRRLEQGGMVLGILEDVIYEQETVILNQGDLLVFYTDGITEPENSYGGEFGEERLLQVIQRVRGRAPREVAAAILQEVDKWSDAPEAADDMTLLVARRL